MKRIVSVLLCVLLAASVFANGAKEQTSSTTPEVEGKRKMTIILRGGTYGKVIEECLPEFEKANNVEIEALDLSFDDLHSKIALNAVNKEGAYDLCMVDGSWMAEFTENNVLLNLSEAGYSFDDDIIPATESICKVGDDIYLAPYFGNVTVMLYNKTLVKAAGYNGSDIKTWDDVAKIAKAANAAGKNGYLIRGGSPDNIVSDFLPVLLANGGWVVDGNNKPTVDTPAFRAALAQYISLYKLGDTMDKDDIVAQIDNGSAALAVGWPGWYVPSAQSNGNYTPIPSQLTASSASYNTALYGVWCIGVPSNSANKDLGVKLLTYLMDKDVLLGTVKNGGVPCRYSSLTNAEVLKTYPQLATVCAALEKGVYRPVIAQWNDFTTILGTEMDNIIKGTETMDVGLARAQAELEDLMAQ
jgi:multiple sugar transport system substrate-binding protein